MDDDGSLDNIDLYRGIDEYEDDDSGVCSWESYTHASNSSDVQAHPQAIKGSPDCSGTPDNISLCSDRSKEPVPNFDNDKCILCDICLGSVNKAAKYCMTCKASYCASHAVDHYRVAAFSSHKYVSFKQISSVPPEKHLSRQWNSSSDSYIHAGLSWKLLCILTIVMPLLTVRFYPCSCPNDSEDLPELRVMLLGKTGAGKSASGNTILGREAFKSEASALPVTKHWQSQSGVVRGRNITIIDTPGITSREGIWLSEKEKEKLGPHIFLLVIHLGRFIEQDCSEVTWIQSNFGEEALKFTIILFTGGDQLKGKSVEKFVHESPKLQTLLDSVEGGYHIFNNVFPTVHDQVKGLVKKMDHTLMKNVGYIYTHEQHVKMRNICMREQEKNNTA